MKDPRGGRAFVRDPGIPVHWGVYLSYDGEN